MSARFEFMATPLDGLQLIRRLPMQDERGWLERMYCAEEFRAVLPHRPIVQINRTATFATGTVRGMHYQLPPHAEIKLISCLKGAVFDVAVDVRRGSPTFMHWHAERLSAENCHSLLIPAGFAHGFQTLEPDCELLYLHTAQYAPQSEAALNARDARVGVRWPLPVSLLSARDAAHPDLTDEFTGVEL
jgi:dTDP-4-dehydrorhamnose 3,5-epimerase